MSGVRIGVLSLVFLAMFSVLTLRLWSMQVTSAEEYRRQADENLVKVVETPAPRGEIRDANGELLAGNRPSLAAVIEGALVPSAVEEELVQRLAAFSGRTAGEVQEIVDEAKQRGDRLTVLGDLTRRQEVFLSERLDEFPGVSIVPQPVRLYPNGELGAHVIGYIGRPDEHDLEKPGVGPSDVLGKDGIERQYDDLLRGTPGAIKYLVDAETIQDILGEQVPRPGSTLYLTLELETQQVLHESLLEALTLAREQHAEGGCEPSDEDQGCPVRAVGVVLRAKDGAVVALDSVPGYDPNIFIGGLTQREFEAFPDGAFNDNVIQGQYAPASTFKAITYVTAMEEGIAPISTFSVEDLIECTAQLNAPFTDASQRVWSNWTFPRDDGLQNIHAAFTRSCNVYFWELALRIWEENKLTERENMLQDWARQLGFGEQTGIDLPFEQEGIVPDRELFVRWAAEQPQRLDAARLDLASPWLGGDLLQVAVGQGSLVVTPLQLAAAYAAMANGGTLYQPYVLDRAVDGNDDVVFEHTPVVTRSLDISATTWLSLRRDMQSVVNGAGGTARSAFADFGPNVEMIGGKTGTAEVRKAQTLEDGTVLPSITTAVFAGVAPINDPEYVVVVVIERGGSGGELAAPTARRVFQYLLNGLDGMTPVAVGEETD
ncbi:MAG TPA: penicillin-binding protein 2 [Acidimicrobiia bacterium]|jgi:penicillin-binding protein 2